MIITAYLRLGARSAWNYYRATRLRLGSAFHRLVSAGHLERCSPGTYLGGLRYTAGPGRGMGGDSFWSVLLFWNPFSTGRTGRPGRNRVLSTVGLPTWWEGSEITTTIPGWRGGAFWVHHSPRLQVLWNCLHLPVLRSTILPFLVYGDLGVLMRL